MWYDGSGEIVDPIDLSGSQEFSDEAPSNSGWAAWVATSIAPIPWVSHAANRA
ncbi:hypothetical protein JCM18909_4033 [Cutibacterium acnes JCM 18909]|nr:hypothetical protein JCM18909_4033 [Cutibacterium acnes JCM 18909]